MSRIIDVIKWGATLGKGEQNFLGARWVQAVLRNAPQSKRREYALKILSLSPHYFLDGEDPRYNRLSKKEYFEEAFRIGREGRERIYDEILKDHLSPHDTVIDYGCGPGYLARVLAQHVKKVYAFDISQGVLACARILNGESNLDYLIPDENGFRHVPDGSVDAVVSIAMVQHLSDEIFDTVLGNCFRKLRVGGRLIMHVHLLDDGWRSEDEWKADRSVRGKIKYKYGLHCFGRTSDELRSVASDHGFGNIDITSIAELVTEQFDDICSEHLLMAVKSD
jgi:cyclopropane fatty-acyl-phospholipid synthase-like methyltransferase